jgi:predicted  nucleic acid-binding Zn-ribbon protein
MDETDEKIKMLKQMTLEMSQELDINTLPKKDSNQADKINNQDQYKALDEQINNTNQKINNLINHLPSI